ncbi:MAG: glycosyltransferase family 4 protein [Dysgonamonadaceae bacterium]|jgi:glycosyltransferase involved in cell wall biosynthesis|nr:glycosyltransferase family 4 protein [Dysgonamonadaceae bacterium]
MKVVLLNTAERTGGAAIAANRLMKALIQNGIETKSLVLRKQSDDANVISVQTSVFKKYYAKFTFLWERLGIFFCNHFNRRKLFQVSIANTGFDVSRHPLVESADIIHIHWINQGFLSLRDIKKLTQLGKPVVWTMHDMWPCTGICHHAWECENFKKSCGQCPFLTSGKKNDLSHRVFEKKSFISDSDIHFVTVSSWLKGKAEKSLITKGLKISIIPNGIDTVVFSRRDKQEMRRKYFLPSSKKIILLGAARIDDPVKGFEYLRDALLLLNEKRDDLFLILIGEIKNKEAFLPQIPVEYLSTGMIPDPATIAQFYAAADVTVVSSYYETFGQTLIESMSCGCPAVSFNNSGQTDIIDHKINGYLAEYKNAADLAKGIEWVIDHPESEKLAEACRKKVLEKFSEPVVAEKYISLYKDL